MQALSSAAWVMHCKAQDEKVTSAPNTDEIAVADVASEALAHGIVAASARKSPDTFIEESM